MFKIYAEKNNKLSLGAHIFVAFGDDGRVCGTLVRIEAESFRRPPWNASNNYWDVFYFEATEGFRDCDFSFGPVAAAETYLTCYYGVYRTLLRRVYEETPLGQEWQDVPVQLRSVLLRDTSHEQREVAKRAAKMALEEGFGTHGRISNEWELRKFSEEPEPADPADEETNSGEDLLEEVPAGTLLTDADE